MTQNERDKVAVVEALREAEMEALKDKPDNEDVKRAKSILSQLKGWTRKSEGDN